MFEEIKQCQKCELCKNQTPLLDTKTECQIMWVGLSAKKKKTEEEIPLSPDTDSGELIQLIEKAFTDPKVKTYKTNLVKCLPLDSNNKLCYPKKLEIDICISHLLSEIQELSPKIVFLLGEKVYSAVDRKLGLSFEKWNNYDFLYKEKDGVYYVPIFHPSYIHVYRRKQTEEYINGVIKIINTLLSFDSRNNLSHSEGDMMDINVTSYSNGFGIFKKVSEEKLDGVQNNILRLFMLNTENKLFNYDELYRYILPNVVKYVFSRKRLVDIENDPLRQTTIILDALSHLRPCENDKDNGAGGELGEILLYLFLEQDLKAPKLFSKVELKTNAKDYVKGSDGIHFKFRKNAQGEPVMQLIIGEAKIKNELNEGIKDAFESINTYITSNIQDRNLIDTHLTEQIVNEEEARIIKEYITAIPRKKKETVFGIFIGYSIDYKGESDSNDEYDRKIIEENIQQVLRTRQLIIEQIIKYSVNNYEFNFYFLPFHNAMRDRRTIMQQLTRGQPYFTREDIRNG